MLPSWEALVDTLCTLGSPPPLLVPLPPQINRPLDFCGRHVMSAAFHPKLPGFLISAHVGPPPPVGVLSAKDLDLTQTALGQEHKCRALGGVRGGVSPLLATPSTKGPPGPAETWAPRSAFGVPIGKKGVSCGGQLPTG